MFDPAAEAEHARRLKALAHNPYVEFLGAGAPVATHRLIVEKPDALAVDLLRQHGFEPLAIRSRFSDRRDAITARRLAALDVIESTLGLSVFELTRSPAGYGPSEATIAAAALHDAGRTCVRVPYLNLGGVDMGPASPPIPATGVAGPLTVSSPAPDLVVAVFDSGLPPDHAVLHPSLGRVTTSDSLDAIYTSPSTRHLDEDGAAGHGMFVSSIIAKRVPSTVAIWAYEVSNQLLTDEAEVDVIVGGYSFSTLVGAVELAADLVSLHKRLPPISPTHLAGPHVIINMSLGGRAHPDDVDLLRRAMLWFVKQRPKTMFCLAAGNKADITKGDDGTREVYPAAFFRTSAELAPHIASVGALADDGTVADYSGRGQWVNSWAPGTHISEYVCGFWIDDDGTRRTFSDAPPFAEWSGTSFATPVVAAAIATAVISGGGGDPLAAWSALNATTSTVTWTGFGGAPSSQIGTVFP